MNRPRLVRSLRIAWSVTWGVVVVLLIALWVRSYLAHDRFYGWFHPSGFFQVDSEYGCLDFIAIAERPPLESHWHFDSKDTEKFVGQWALTIPWRPQWSVILVVPDWFVFLIVTTAATASWTTWRSARFSLRALLIAMTLVAVSLGIIVWATK
jgi:hypothetical protein